MTLTRHSGLRVLQIPHRDARLTRAAASSRGLDRAALAVDDDRGLGPDDLGLGAARSLAHAVAPRSAVAGFGRLARLPAIDAAAKALRLVVEELLADQAGHVLKACGGLL